MRYLDFLQRVHETLEPPTYLEIGVRHGDSLALSRSPSIGIDPGFKLRTEPPAGAKLFRQTSDDYFERPKPLRHFAGRPAALAFIDGMHLIDYALRDFVNVERHAHWSSVVVFDDILPRTVDEAARERVTRAWTGDVFKILAILAEHRPDLVCLRVGTEPTGLLLVLGLDPANRTLADRYEDIVVDTVTVDPQEVPDDVLERRGVLDPDAVLGASFWSVLRDGRAADLSRRRGMHRLHRALRRDFGPGVSAGPLRRLLPLPS
jgi:hypothetical protein